MEIFKRALKETSVLVDGCSYEFSKASLTTLFESDLADNRVHLIQKRFKAASSLATIRLYGSSTEHFTQLKENIEILSQMMARKLIYNPLHVDFSRMLDEATKRVERHKTSTEGTLKPFEATRLTFQFFEGKLGGYFGQRLVLL